MTDRFKVVVADPPWDFRDLLPGSKRGARTHYKTTGPEEIARYVLPPLADDCVLFMWRVSALQEEALRVVRAWGFVPKSETVWRKTRPCAHLHKENPFRSNPPYDVGSNLVALDGDKCPICSCSLTRWFGMGRVTRAEHESCIIAKRGRPQTKSKSVRSVFTAPAGKHSQKPECFYRSIVEKLFDGPYLELFARRPRDGWTTLGLELGTPMDVKA